MVCLNDSKLLQLNNISLSDNDNCILRDIHLDISKGEIIGLVGDIGAGKSTFAKVICGLKKQTSGTIKFEGKDISKIKPSNYHRNISMVFQFPEKQIFEETVYRELSFSPKNFGLSDKEIKNKVYYYIDRIGLDASLLDRPPLFLSGGELRKVALLSSIVLEPKLLILDEPFTWLDESSALMLKEIVLSIQKGNGAVMIIGHDVQDFGEICTRICHLTCGKLVYDDDFNGYLRFLEENES